MWNVPSREPGLWPARSWLTLHLILQFVAQSQTEAIRYAHPKCDSCVGDGSQKLIYGISANMINRQR